MALNLIRLTRIPEKKNSMFMMGGHEVLLDYSYPAEFLVDPEDFTSITETRREERSDWDSDEKKYRNETVHIVSEIHLFTGKTVYVKESIQEIMRKIER